MKSYTLVLWLVGVALEVILLTRGWLSRWFSRYPVFFAYLVSVFLLDLFFFAVYLTHVQYYAAIYWYAEFFSLALGCAVTWEIFRLVLGRYPGAGQMARNVLLFAVIVVVTKGLVEAWSGLLSWPTTAVEVERNLRGVQAASLIVLALLVVYYVVPIGRNVMGIFIGYSLFVATSVMTLSLRTSLGTAFEAAWIFVQPLSYTAVLAIWCKSLWMLDPAPLHEAEPKIEEDYQSLALATRKVLLHARAFLGKGMRP